MAKTASLLALLTAVHGLDDGSADFYQAVTGGGQQPAHSDNSTGVQVLLKEYVASTGARCLDGTPGAYYIRKGVGSGANKWYIHHQGGGWCESWDDCYARSNSSLGSSAGYASSTALKGGYFDPSPQVNPMMYNWNTVFMPYCDGGSFSGNNETITTYKGKPLYYVGKRVREAVYDSLLQHQNLRAATDVVISGCSAGGLATFLHTDQWCDSLKRDATQRVKCVGLPDSGFFLDYQDPRRNANSGQLANTLSGNYHAGLKWVFEQMNTTAGLHPDCISAKSTGGVHTDDPAYLCQFAEHTSVFTHSPLFPLQSEYDSWQTRYVLYYPNTAGDVQVLGNNITRRMGANLLGPHPQSGAFLDSCWHHCGMWDRIRIDGELVSTAFAKWYDGLGQFGESIPPKTLWAQKKAFECDDCCKP